jgi:hypothetical protein
MPSGLKERITDSLANASAHFIDSDRAGNASPANDGAFAISFHVPTMPFRLQGVECRRSLCAWAAHGMKRIDGYSMSSR